MAKTSLKTTNSLPATKANYVVDLAKLAYLHCIMNETLRLSVTAQSSLHVSNQRNVQWSVDVPRATMLMVNIWPLYNDPDLWEDPTTFKPELFEAVKWRMKG
ncbi:hypothetical protein RJ639_005904 [Escallonia herrerae]|uniref:Cytochrome P450 n=1 Tax=Escallonia herrerae TaxID=1293975 RepID=A0AA89AU18_9ASTE|nr:hypothetical protein RJ639_005904 [Escallonia herrerae]